MATYTRVEIIDDLDGSTADGGTHRISLDGVQYEIDLSGANFDRLSSALEPFITAGRRQLQRSNRIRRVLHTAASARTENEAIRAWWATNQRKMNLPQHKTRGAIPHPVRDAYRTTR
jgi:hypothetical protein